MIETALFAVAVIGILMAGMAVGVIFSNKPIKGSCGGLNAIGITGKCEICGDDPAKCDVQEDADPAPDTARQTTEPMAYDAMQASKPSDDGVRP